MGLLFAGIAAALWESTKSGPPDVGQDASPEATQARNRIQELVSGSGLDFQGAKVPESAYKDPEGMDDLYARVQKMDPAAVKMLHDRWEGLRNKLNDGFVAFGLEMTRAIESKWQGEAAASAATGITEYVKKSSTLVDSVALVSEKVKLVRSAIDITKPNVQEAPDTTVTSNIASWVPGPTWKLNDHREESYQSAAANVVKNVFYPAVKEADDKVPMVPKPYNPVQSADVPEVKEPARPSAGVPDSGPVRPAVTDEPEAGARPGETEPGAGPQSADDPGTKPTAVEAPTTPASTVPVTADAPKAAELKPNSGLPGSAAPGVPGSGVPGTSVPGSGQPGAKVPGSGRPGASVPGSGVPNSGVPGAGVPGSRAPGTSGPGSRAPGTGVPGGGNPGAGKTVSGAPGSAVAASGANRTATTRAGTSGMPGMGGVGANRGTREDDKEHQTKEYLINQENGEILTGLDPEHRVKTVPPVIGE
ncbi:hypothetical protein [Nocardia sp. NPDC048505]|uniref:hypothetical protein n=1 Tax=unclassified Nocardia TaxID=2637762 RepID=UPI0033E39092